MRICLRHDGPRPGLDEPHPIIVVTDVPFFFEDAELCANGRIARTAGQFVHHLGRRGPGPAEEHVHNFTFPPRESGME